MKITRPFHSFLISVRSRTLDLLPFLRFSEPDACALPSAYGPAALAVHRLQNDCPNEQRETGGTSGKVSRRKRTGAPPGPHRIGVHPDVTQARRVTPLAKQVLQHDPEASSTHLLAESLIPVQSSPERAWTRPPNGPDQPTTTPSRPADLDAVMLEIAEECRFDWPESLTVARVYLGMVELLATVSASAVSIVLLPKRGKR